MQLARDKKTLDEKLQETQSALEAEEGKAKGEHRARLKLESAVQELEEKMERESAVSIDIVMMRCSHYSSTGFTASLACLL